MRDRTYQTSVNLLIEADSYSRLKKAKIIKKTSMSKIIRQGILLVLDKIDKENNAVIVEKTVSETKNGIYTRPVPITLPEEMFEQIKSITDRENMGLSDYIRVAIQEKLTTTENNKIQKTLRR